MIKRIEYFGLKICWLVLVVNLLAGCSGRHASPDLKTDGTLLYTLKDGRALLWGISFYKITDGETELPVGVDTVFTLSDKQHLRARVVLNEPVTEMPMFHLDWTGPDQQSFFMKSAEVFSDSVTTFLYSTVSLSPAKRDPGLYKLRVYYFRELVAEKSVILLSEKSINRSLADKLKPIVTLCEKVNKKTGYRFGVDTVFQIRENATVRAFVDLDDTSGFSKSKLLFELLWIGPDGEVFYRKNIDARACGFASTLYSSVSIAPGKRKAGNYLLEVYLFDEMISEKKFRLE